MSAMESRGSGFYDHEEHEDLDDAGADSVEADGFPDLREPVIVGDEAPGGVGFSGRGGSRVGGSRGGGSRSRGHRLLRALVVGAVVVLLVIGAGVVWAEHQINPGGRRGPAVSVVVPSGASTTEIGRILGQAGVIHAPTLFAFYVRLHGDGPLFPGTYVLERNSSYQSAISALESGPKVLTDDLVVPEGFTVRDIAAAVAALPGLHLSASQFVTDATDGAVRSQYEPAGTHNLEGLLFPATYQVRQGEAEVQILQEMVAAFDEHAGALGLQAAASRLGYSPYQVVEVASIVEREAKVSSDRGPVASVIYNRLRLGMPLGADSTETYYLRLTDPTLQPTPEQLDQPGPYNTRLDKGLPPTPISNPGLASLEAAASPPSTDYLYFVEVNPDGKLGFASTSAGFSQLQAECQAAKLC